MFTANTMASMGEALGVSLRVAAPPSVDRRRDDDAYARAGRHRALQLGIPPRDILTKEAFEKAIAVADALGGSTNAVLHLLAIANEARVELSLDDFNRVAARVPHIADMKPGGKFHMTDLDPVGGIPVVMRHLLDAGLWMASPHRDRPHHGREPDRARPACTRRRRRAPAGRSDPPGGWAHRAAQVRSPRGAW